MMNTNGCEERVDPCWVPSLLYACKRQDRLEHSSSCNPGHKFLPNFCVTCVQLYCRACPEFRRTNHPHRQHVVLLVCKASRENCLHASEVSKLIDISDIHLFIFNRKQIVFLYRRGSEQSKSGSNKSGYTCKTCGREFKNDKKFCSVQCKTESGENLGLIKQKAEGEEPIIKPKSNLLRLTVKQKAKGEEPIIKPKSNRLRLTVKQKAKGEEPIIKPKSNLLRLTFKQKAEGEKTSLKPQSNLSGQTTQKAEGEETALKPQSNLSEQTKQNAEGEKAAVMQQSYRKRSRKGVPSPPLPFVYPVDICWCGDWTCARAMH